MTLPATTRRSPIYTGNGASTAFAFSFKVFTSADIQVLITSPAGVLSTAVLNSDYTVALNSDQVASPGGTVTYNPLGVPLPVNAKLVILGAIPYDQTLALPGGGNFNPVAIENTLDRTEMQIQQLAASVAGAITVPIGETVPALPAAAVRAGYVLGFDTSGNPIAVAPVSGSVGTLATDLVNNVTPSKGSGQVGWSIALAYAAGTVGRGLNDLYAAVAAQATALAAAAGSALVGFLQAGVGAVLRTVQSKLRERVSVLDFGASAAAAAAVNDAAFAAAIAATTFDGIVEVPDPGSGALYNLSAPITLAGATGSGRLVGIGKPTLKFSGLGAAVDGITTTGSSYRQSQLENFIIDMSLSGRDGVVLQAGNRPIQRNITVQNTLRDAFSYQCTGFNWIEKLQRSHCTGVNIGRHHTYAMNSGANGAYINEVYDLHPEIRGCAQKVTGGTAIVADSQGTVVGGSQISGWHLIDPVFDAVRNLSVANGFDVGVNPILCKYNAAAAAGGQYDSWKIIGGGLETTSGTPVPGVGLVKVESGAQANGWFLSLGNPGGWPTGGGYVGLRDFFIQDRQTGKTVTRDSGVSAGLKIYAAGVGGPYTVDLPFPVLPGFGAAFVNSGTPGSVAGSNNDNGALVMPSQLYKLVITYQQYTGAGFCYYTSEFPIFYNIDNANGWGVGANNVIVNTLGGFITVNSVTIDPANNRVRLSISTTATYGAAGGNTRMGFGLMALGFMRDTL